MTPENFEDFCKDICPHCQSGAAVRWRDDSKEWCHDVTTEIPGTLGKRQVHAFCLASNFRKKWKDQVGGKS